MKGCNKNWLQQTSLINNIHPCKFNILNVKSFTFVNFKNRGVQGVKDVKYFALRSWSDEDLKLRGTSVALISPVSLLSLIFGPFPLFKELHQFYQHL